MGLFRMPSLGADMEAGKLVEWLKQPGEEISSGDIIAVVETQKGAIEIEAFETGTLDQLLVLVGQTVPVGTPLAAIRGAGEAAVTLPPALPPALPPVAPAAAPLAPVAQAASATPAVASGLKASPAARKFATEHGIDLAGVSGSGPEGAIVFVDVENAWRAAGAPKAAPAKPAPAGSEGMRTAIAAAMSRSKREIPHYYLSHAADVTDATAWLERRNADCAPQDRILFGALLLKAVAASLAGFPEFNGHFGKAGYVASKSVHLGMAIALRGGGLIAPAIHDADQLTLAEAMKRLHDLVNRVRAGRFRSSEMADPTATLTSLGERGADWVLPVIYPPQVAIVGAGSPVEEPRIVDGKVVPRTICRLTLGADHRVSDGHRGALLLRAIADRLQKPEAL
ncbi:MAG TPA: dihydrolipoamide acetyltransferase family protein [Alphaproteobacteria bacterium]|nr:dihydrolipoamide acetyltransferase family protein [Alphaproteobacteria bacterium]